MVVEVLEVVVQEGREHSLLQLDMTGERTTTCKQKSINKLWKTESEQIANGLMESKNAADTQHTSLLYVILTDHDYFTRIATGKFT